MNKYITLLILVVVLCAMSMVLILHTSGKPETVVAGAGDTVPSLVTDDTPLPEMIPAIPVRPLPETPQPPVVVARNDQAVELAPQVREQPDIEQPTPASPPSTNTGGTGGSPAAGGTESGRGPEPDQPPSSPPVAETPPVREPVVDPARQAPPAAEPEKPALSFDPARLSLTESHSLTKISMHFSGNRIYLRIEADKPFPVKSFVLDNPSRLVVDLPGTWKGVQAPVVPNNRVVKGVRVGTQAAGPRLVLDLEKAPKYEVVRPSDNVVEVHVQ